METHPLIEPFRLENTKDWRERRRISQSLEDIRKACEEVEAFTDKSGSTFNIDEADDSMRSLQALCAELFRETATPEKSDCERCQGKGYVWVETEWPTRKEACPECVGNMSNKQISNPSKEDEK